MMGLAGSRDGSEMSGSIGSGAECSWGGGASNITRTYSKTCDCLAKAINTKTNAAEGMIVVLDHPGLGSLSMVISTRSGKAPMRRRRHLLRFTYTW